MELDTSKRDVAKSSPWGKVAQPSAASASLSEIMSEQLAVDLHDKYVFVFFSIKFISGFRQREKARKLNLTKKFYCSA
jgi:hypothetical protein